MSRISRPSRFAAPLLLCLVAQSTHAQWATEHDRAAATLLSLHNAERSRQGLEHLQPDPRLVAAAIEQSECQAQRDRCTHEGCDGRPWFQRISDHGYRARASSESVAAGPRYSPFLVIEHWLGSKVGHRANVLGNWTHAGFARRTSQSGLDYWTAVYARAR